MKFPCSHKTVVVLDHGPQFAQPCHSVEFDVQRARGNPVYHISIYYILIYNISIYNILIYNILIYNILIYNISIYNILIYDKEGKSE